jgi:hypothetical protein
MLMSTDLWHANDYRTILEDPKKWAEVEQISVAAQKDVMAYGVGGTAVVRKLTATVFCVRPSERFVIKKHE